MDTAFELHVEPMGQLAVTSPDAPSRKSDGKSIRILAKSLFRELRQQGYEPKQVLGLATELLGLVTTELRENAGRDDRAAP